MVKKLTIAQRYARADILGVVKELRTEPPGKDDAERKKLHKLLSQEKCPCGLLMWGALCGSLEVKQQIASNPALSMPVIEALMMDTESAPWYVFDILGRDDILSTLICDLYGSKSPYPDAATLDKFFYPNSLSPLEEHWKQFIPKQGYCETMQSELLRILWRFSNTLYRGFNYTLHYDDQMFIVLNNAVDSIPDISSFGRNVLRAFLRWSQIQQRSRETLLPSHGHDAPAPVVMILDVYWRKFPEAVPFDSKSIYGS